MTRYVFIIFFFFLSALAEAQEGKPFIYVLGIAQDGGYPHLGCQKKCCANAWKKKGQSRYVTCLALVDPAEKKWWLLEATPDIKEQLHYFQQLTNGQYNYLPEGIFITHAHIGHYIGLAQLGREVMNTCEVPVYALPRMKSYLETNGPWSQLVSLRNIVIKPLVTDSAVVLNKHIKVTAFTVPHRDEYSETAGYRIEAEGKTYLFIPDINKWDKWDRGIVAEVAKADIALLDGTFYDSTELPGRKMSEVPHPFVQETMNLFKNEPASVKAKLHFIHFNHTNPILSDKKVRKSVKKKGYDITVQGEAL